MKQSAVENVLISMGMPISIKGFQYIVDSMEYFDNNDVENIKITKDLYPDIAKKRKTTSQRVERAIRHALERVRELDCKQEIVRHYFGFNLSTNYNSLKMFYIILKREMEENADGMTEHSSLDVQEHTEAENADNRIEKLSGIVGADEIIKVFMNELRMVIREELERIHDNGTSYDGVGNSAGHYADIRGNA